ncbi:MAG TPA: SURF1 family protein [Sphingobium sp.]
MALALLLIAGGFVALGIWQLERRIWKHRLIAAVASRSHAVPVAAPGPAQWPGVSADRDAYRRIRVSGTYLQNRRTLVQAVTDIGPGYWVIVPLDTGRFTLLVNRGFIAQDQRAAPASEPAGRVTITGLLRVTEPEGGFLRANDPATGRWYSRDTAAIARARGLPATAPYFLDADSARNAPGQPVGGLTVIRFADNHLGYALTWFGMAGLSLWGLSRLRAARDEREDGGAA